MASLTENARGILDDWLAFEVLGVVADDEKTGSFRGIIRAMNGDEILEVLKQIRDEAKQTNSRLESLEGRVDETNSRLHSLDGRVDFLEKRTSKGFEELSTRLNEHVDRLDLLTRRQTDSELRLASEELSLADVTRDVRDLLSRKLDDHNLVLEHDKRIRSLEDRIADGPSDD